MKCYYLTFRSIVLAQRGERVLNQNQIRCSLQRTPRWMEEQGCGYALRIWTTDIGQAANLIRREGLVFGRVYAQAVNGVLQEVEP